MRTRLLSVSFLLLALLAASRSSVGQGSEITEADFWAAVRTSTAVTKASFPRREIEKFEGTSYRGTSYVSTETTDFSAADRSHLITVMVDGDKRTSEEVIQVGSQRFCRENSDPWRTSNCWANPPAALETAIEAQFRIDKSDKGTTYFRKSIYLVQETGKAEKTRFQSEDTLVLNPNMTVRERTITNSSQQTGAIQFRQTWKHEYGVKLDPIEAPIQ